MCEQYGYYITHINIHFTQLHSSAILLMNQTTVVGWYNPLVNTPFPYPFSLIIIFIMILLTVSRIQEYALTLSQYPIIQFSTQYTILTPFCHYNSYQISILPTNLSIFSISHYISGIQGKPFVYFLLTFCFIFAHFSARG